MCSFSVPHPADRGGRPGQWTLASRGGGSQKERHQMNIVRIGLVGLFCALVGTGVAAAANGSSADSGSVSKVAPVAQSGNTGDVHVSSQSTNSGSTGNATSSAIASPQS